MFQKWTVLILVPLVFFVLGMGWMVYSFVHSAELQSSANIAAAMKSSGFIQTTGPTFGTWNDTVHVCDAGMNTNKPFMGAVLFFATTDQSSHQVRIDDVAQDHADDVIISKDDVSLKLTPDMCGTFDAWARQNTNYTNFIRNVDTHADLDCQLPSGDHIVLKVDGSNCP